MSLHCLIVDDNKLNNILMKKLLTRGCCKKLQIITTTDSVGALDIIVKSNFDFIITDVNMPDMDGIQLTKKIRSLKNIKQPYIVGVTGNEDSYTHQRCITSGMNKVFLKPMQLKVLQELVNYLKNNVYI